MTSAPVVAVDASNAIKRYGSRSVVLWAEYLDATERVVSENLTLFVRPKHLMLTDPSLETVERSMDGNTFNAVIRTKAPALWVNPQVEDNDAVYSDRFFHLMPHRPVTVAIESSDPSVALDDLTLRLSSVWHLQA